MQPGSIVELQDDNWDANRFMYLVKQGFTYPTKGRLYTVREHNNQGTGIRLDEIRNPKIEFGAGIMENSFNMKRFREVFPPVDNVEEWSNQNTSVDIISRKPNN
jgi:hypothetical protein